MPTFADFVEAVVIPALVTTCRGGCQKATVVTNQGERAVNVGGHIAWLEDNGWQMLGPAGSEQPFCGACAEKVK